jgi:hypothetical protein
LGKRLGEFFGQKPQEQLVSIFVAAWIAFRDCDELPITDDVLVSNKAFHDGLRGAPTVERAIVGESLTLWSILLTGRR